MRAIVAGVSARLVSLAKAALQATLPDPTFHVVRHVGFCARSPARVLRALGPASAARFLCVPVWFELERLAAGPKRARRAYTLTTPDAKFPLRCRAGSSDAEVFRQIFVEREYAWLGELSAPRYLLDCGANVGFASAWFLSRYPGLQAIAVEPDPENAAVLRDNLSPFGARVTIQQHAVWSRSVGLKLVRGEFRDGREWAVQVREAAAGEAPDLHAVDIGSLMKGAGWERIDLLKVDIEGAEGEVFREPSVHWLERVQNLVIELHGPELEAVVDAALCRSEFERSQAGELTWYRRLQPVAAARSEAPSAGSPIEA